MIPELVGILKERGETLAFAESCTGGKLSGQLVSLEGVSSVYLGSIVAYANAIKQDVLKVPSTLIKTVGAVSDPVALAMARGVRNLTKSSWAVSITGIAGPSGGTETKPVGTVWFAVVGPGLERTYHKQFTGDRQQIQDQSVNFAIETLMTHLKGD